MRHILEIEFRTWIGPGKKTEITPVDAFKGKVEFEAKQHQSGNALVLIYRSDEACNIAELIEHYNFIYKGDTFQMLYRMELEPCEIKI